MIIGINAAAAIKQPRTGIEEYTYQLIKHLTMLPETREHRFLLYFPDTNTQIGTSDTNNKYFDFLLPLNFEIKILRWPLPFLWTQMRLAYEVWRHKPDVLFIPVHILPFGAPRNSIVAIHGLEYEYFPEYYSFRRCFYLHWSTKSAVKRARKIIAISENTRQDLIKLYGVEEEKISVVHHGVSSKIFNDPLQLVDAGRANPNNQTKKPYLLYVGRIETKKNVQGILEAYKILKEKYKIPHELILAGVPGFGYEKIKSQIKDLLEIRNLNLDIKEVGYISNDEKHKLLTEASIFLSPSFYEGFGLPILEAQAMGVPVVTSLGSCLPEIAGQGALFVNPRSSIEIAEAVKQIIDDSNLRDRLRQSGFENIKRFSWEKCAEQTLKIILNFKD